MNRWPTCTPDETIPALPLLLGITRSVPPGGFYRWHCQRICDFSGRFCFHVWSKLAGQRKRDGRTKTETIHYSRRTFLAKGDLTELIYEPDNVAVQLWLYDALVQKKRATFSDSEQTMEPRKPQIEGNRTEHVLSTWRATFLPPATSSDGIL